MAEQTKYAYRDSSLSVEERVEDLIKQMTVPEKAGQLFHDMMIMGPGGTLSGPNDAFGLAGTEKAVGERLMTHFNLLGPIHNPREVAEWYNRLQKRALETRLGIPVTMSTDPRNHFTDNVGTSFNAGVLSQWPETLGFAALRSPELVQRFADIARQEYIALGLRTALHPQIDLATEPRWARINATFGEDADLSGDLVEAYIRGLQGIELGPQSVAAMTKHFPGGGPQKDGEDPHFDYGKDQVYPGNHFEYHLKPFKKAIAANTAQMMPYYGRPVGTEHEEVGFAFNKGIITGILREQLGYKGVICTDWGLVTDVHILGQNMPARAWGVEHLSELDKVKKILDAGCDQLGGESRPELVVELVEKGMVSESRIDESLRRILRDKFVLGLFDNPFVDVEAVVHVVGNAQFVQEGNDAQRRAYTLLTNKDGLLPLSSSSSRKVYTEGISDPTILSGYGLHPVSDPKEADLAILRLRAPYEPRPGGFESHFHAGSLEYASGEKSRLAAVFAAVPLVVVDMYLDRPAVVPEIADRATALLANYGASSEALLDVLFARDGVRPMGKLPFDLPRSMDAVRKSREDVPYDTQDPLFRFGHGLGYDAVSDQTRYGDMILK